MTVLSTVECGGVGIRPTHQRNLRYRLNAFCAVPLRRCPSLFAFPPWRNEPHFSVTRFSRAVRFFRWSASVTDTLYFSAKSIIASDNSRRRVLPFSSRSFFVLVD